MFSAIKFFFKYVFVFIVIAIGVLLFNHFHKMKEIPYSWEVLPSPDAYATFRKYTDPAGIVCYYIQTRNTTTLSCVKK